MAFGLSFGRNRTRTNQTTNVNRNETGTQAGTNTTNQTQTNTSSGTQSTQGNTQGSSNTSQSGTQTSQNQNTQTQSGVTQNFGDQVLGGLEGAVNELLSSVFDSGGNRSAIGAGLNHLGQFDPNSFVASAMARAEAQTESNLDEILGGIFDAIGGKNNSAASLLANRAGNEATANLAGIESQLTGQAQEIVRNNALAGNQVDSTQNDLLTQLTGALRGGRTTQTGSSQSAGSESQANQTTGTTNTSEASSQNQQNQQSEVSNLVSILTSLLNTNTNTVGTENVRGTTTSRGGGASFST